MIDFTGQQVIVVGGSSGIGFATAKIAAQLGAQVVIASRSAEKLTAGAEAIGHGVKGVVLDITSDAQVEKLFAGSEWDHVIVTASQVAMAPVREASLETARAAFDSKYWGFYRVARAARIRPGGSLSVVAGFLAQRPMAGAAYMGSINGALQCLVQGLALEMKPVRVNAVSPAVVDTEMWSGLSAEARAGMYAGLRKSYPAGCIGTPEDVARQLLLLASSPYATGTIVTLDGGASIS